MANAFQKEGPVITPENPEKPVKTNREIWAEKLGESKSVRIIQFILGGAILILFGMASPLWNDDALHIAQATFYIICVMGALIVVYWQASDHLCKKNKIFAVSCSAILIHLGLIILLYQHAGSFPPAWSIQEVGLPYILAPLMVSVLLGPRMGTFAALSVSILGVFYVGSEGDVRIQYLVTSLVTGMLTVYMARDVRSRAQILRAGVFAGLLVLLMSGAAGLLNVAEGQEVVSSLAWKISISFLVSFFLAILVSGMLPALESFCKIITPISWLELTDMNHKLLKKLQLEAPGTFHHSIVVAQLAEAAAEAIGANGNYCRVVSYYHDIGKIKHPQFFIENLIEGEQNPHDELTPTMSARIIIGHVADGVELARESNLNKPILDAIQQHHGTSMAYFFYRKALEYRKEMEERVALGLAKLDDVPEVLESNFRYAGPIPQNKEVAIVSLADIIESATRSLQKPTYDELVEMIDNLIRARIVEGHLDESGLTLGDIRSIRDSFISTLKSMRHSRVSYPKADAGKQEDEKTEPSPGKVLQPVVIKAPGSLESPVKLGSGEKTEGGKDKAEDANFEARLANKTAERIDEA